MRRCLRAGRGFCVSTLAACLLVCSGGCDELGNPGVTVGRGPAIRTRVQSASARDVRGLLAQVPLEAIDYRDTAAIRGGAVTLVTVELTGVRLRGPLPLETVFLLRDGRRLARAWSLRPGPTPRYGIFALPAEPMEARTRGLTP